MAVGLIHLKAARAVVRAREARTPEDVIMQHSKHVVFVLLVVVVVAIAGALALAALVPESFGWRDGHYYRQDALDEQKDPEGMRFPLVYAAADSCLRAECHGEEAKQEELQVFVGGGHETVGCQICHGPAVYHVESEGKEHAPHAPVTTSLCLTCHAAMVGRPADFKQIADFDEHRTEHKGPMRENCIACHDYHATTPIKLEDGHANLTCQRCHGPDGNPLTEQGVFAAYDPAKEVAVCMACHGGGEGEGKSTKQIESFESHRDDQGGTEDDTCRDCHDPHSCETY
jgi:hypothetical protein